MGDRDGTHFGLYGIVRKTPSWSIRNALQTSSATLAVAVAVKQMTRSALISSTKRATIRHRLSDSWSRKREVSAAHL